MYLCAQVALEPGPTMRVFMLASGAKGVARWKRYRGYPETGEVSFLSRW
jgi:hypothetical protein